MACTELKPLAAAVESSLARLVPRFTMSNGWSLYALDTFGYAPLASIDYHRSHIRMFTLLSERTGESAFGHAVDRWQEAVGPSRSEARSLSASARRLRGCATFGACRSRTACGAESRKPSERQMSRALGTPAGAGPRCDQAEARRSRWPGLYARFLESNRADGGAYPSRICPSACAPRAPTASAADRTDSRGARARRPQPASSPCAFADSVARSAATRAPSGRAATGIEIAAEPPTAPT